MREIFERLLNEEVMIFFINRYPPLEAKVQIASRDAVLVSSLSGDSRFKRVEHIIPYERIHHVERRV